MLIFVWYQLPIINPKDGSKIHGTVKFTTDRNDDNLFNQISLDVNNVTVDWWSTNMDCLCPKYLSYNTNELPNGWHHFQVSRYYSITNSSINSIYMLQVSNL